MTRALPIIIFRNASWTMKRNYRCPATPAWRKRQVMSNCRTAQIRMTPKISVLHRQAMRAVFVQRTGIAIHPQPSGQAVFPVLPTTVSHLTLQLLEDSRAEYEGNLDAQPYVGDSGDRDLVLHLDLAETFLQAAGVPVLGRMQGGVC
jgi:hypothetical protein